MRPTELKTKFAMSYADLNQLADKLIMFARRDLADLGAYGITSQWLDDLKALNYASKAFPTDEEFVGDQKRATLNKDEAREALHNLLSSVMARVRSVYTLESPEYVRFDIKGISQMSDSDFARMAGRVHRNIMMRMSELQPSGITPAIIADFLQAINLFDESIELKEDAVSNRDAGTQERVMLANAIYDQLSQLADFGKVCYAPINEAKYNDYIIYDLPAAPKATENKTEVAKTDVAPAAEIKTAVTPTEETNTDNQA